MFSLGVIFISRKYIHYLTILRRDIYRIETMVSKFFAIVLCEIEWKKYRYYFLSMIDKYITDDLYDTHRFMIILYASEVRE